MLWEVVSNKHTVLWLAHTNNMGNTIVLQSAELQNANKVTLIMSLNTLVYCVHLFLASVTLYLMQINTKWQQDNKYSIRSEISEF
jgi:hypothetical protein